MLLYQTNVRGGSSKPWFDRTAKRDFEEHILFVLFFNAVNMPSSMSLVYPYFVGKKYPHVLYQSLIISFWYLNRPIIICVLDV